MCPSNRIGPPKNPHRTSKSDHARRHWRRTLVVKRFCWKRWSHRAASLYKSPRLRRGGSRILHDDRPTLRGAVRAPSKTFQTCSRTNPRLDNATNFRSTILKSDRHRAHRTGRQRCIRGDLAFRSGHCDNPPCLFSIAVSMPHASMLDIHLYIYIQFKKCKTWAGSHSADGLGPRRW